MSDYETYQPPDPKRLEDCSNQEIDEILSMISNMEKLVIGKNDNPISQRNLIRKKRKLDRAFERLIDAQTRIRMKRILKERNISSVFF